MRFLTHPISLNRVRAHLKCKKSSRGENAPRVCSGASKSGGKSTFAEGVRAEIGFVLTPLPKFCNLAVCQEGLNLWDDT